MCENSQLIGPKLSWYKQMVMFSYKLTSLKVMCEKSSIIGQNAIWFEQMVMLSY